MYASRALHVTYSGTMDLFDADVDEPPELAASDASSESDEESDDDEGGQPDLGASSASTADSLLLKCPRCSRTPRMKGFGSHRLCRAVQVLTGGKYTPAYVSAMLESRPRAPGQGGSPAPALLTRKCLRRS